MPITAPVKTHDKNAFACIASPDLLAGCTSPRSHSHSHSHSLLFYFFLPSHSFIFIFILFGFSLNLLVLSSFKLFQFFLLSVPLCFHSMCVHRWSFVDRFFFAFHQPNIRDHTVKHNFFSVYFFVLFAVVFIHLYVVRCVLKAMDFRLSPKWIVFSGLLLCLSRFISVRLVSASRQMRWRCTSMR